MKIRNPMFKVRLPIAGSFLTGLIGSLLLMISTAAAAPFEEQLNRIENKLSLIKMDVLRFYQSGAIGSDQSSLPLSARASGGSVVGQEDQKSPVPPQGEVNFQTIAVLMKRLAPAADSAAPPPGARPSSHR
ncbi:MAG: hypothetical protein HY283_08550 [Nitrospirae bacterium]|nr:hypothetical protein [Nitrospirota bacterium]